MSIEKDLPDWLRAIRWDAQGLVTAIAQDYQKHDILMVAYMNAQSLQMTLEKGEMVFWSRSRQEIWHKGATSGNTLKVHSFALDCDGDVLLFQVEIQGMQAACHTGRRTCFHRVLNPETLQWDAQGPLVFDPKQVYKP